MFQGALFGAGNIALCGHALALRSDPILRDQLRITSCCDPSPANLEAAAAAWPGVRLYGSAEALLAAERPDFIDIASPPSSHVGLLRQAAERDLHIFCEKPLCRTLQEARDLDPLLRGRAIVFLPAHEYHHAPPWQAVVQAVRGGEIGELRLVEWNVRRTEANPGNAHWDAGWRTDPEIAGGGILMDHGAHVAYQLRSLLGDPLRVTSRLHRLRSEPYRVEDTATAILEYAGAVARLGFTWAAGTRAIESRLVGTRGEIHVTDDRIELARGPERQELSFSSGMSAGSAHGGWFVPLFRDFLARMIQRNYDRGPWDEAVAALRLLDSCYRSAALGQTVTLGATA